MGTASSSGIGASRVPPVAGVLRLVASASGDGTNASGTAGDCESEGEELSKRRRFLLSGVLHWCRPETRRLVRASPHFRQVSKGVAAGG